jgi:nucleoside-diphosphate-sugar epimerase
MRHDKSRYKRCTYINLRIFNTFGTFESPQRFIKASVNNCIAGRDIIIHQDKLMDFLYIEDLYKVIDYTLHNKINSRFFEMDIVYEEKNTLVSIAEKIKDAGCFENEIIIESPESSLDYVGSSVLFYKFIQQYGITLDGLDSGINIMIKELNEGI